jgi:hypothetical protein
LQQAFFGLFDGSTADTRGWLTPITPHDSVECGQGRLRFDAESVQMEAA